MIADYNWPIGLTLLRDKSYNSLSAWIETKQRKKNDACRKNGQKPSRWKKRQIVCTSAYCFSNWFKAAWSEFIFNFVYVFKRF